MTIQHSLPWFLYALWVTAVLYFGASPDLFALDKPYSALKYAVWAVFLAFTVYTYYCSARENLFKSIKKIAQLHWGRQIGIDLYIGLFLSLLLIFLHQGSVWVMLLWLVPCIVFGNLATLLYFAVHFDSLVETFFH